MVMKTSGYCHTDTNWKQIIAKGETEHCQTLFTIGRVHKHRHSASIVHVLQKIGMGFISVFVTGFRIHEEVEHKPVVLKMPFFRGQTCPYLLMLKTTTEN